MIQFDHVYVERAVRDAPVTRDLLARLQPPRVTGIDEPKGTRTPDVQPRSRRHYARSQEA